MLPKITYDTWEGVIRRALAIVGGERRVHPQRLLQHHVQILQTQNGVVAQHGRRRTARFLLLLFKGSVNLSLQLPLNFRVCGQVPERVRERQAGGVVPGDEEYERVSKQDDLM